MLPVIFLVSFLLALNFYMGASAFGGNTGFLYDEAILTREQFIDFWENDPSQEAQREIRSTVLLTEDEKVQVSNPSTDVLKNTMLIKAAGDMSLAMPEALMSGSFVSDQDETGCVISKKTAEELFGTHQAAGQSLLIGSDIYTVRGVLDITESLCMIQGKPNTLYNEVRVKAPRIPVSLVTQLLAACIPGTYTFISEGGLYAGVARLAVWTPAWVLMAVIFVLIKRMAKESFIRMEEGGRKKEWLQTAFGIVFPIAIFAAACLLLLASVHFSDDFVPGAWSDFSFWGELFTEKWKQTYALVSQKVAYADGKMAVQTAGCIISSAVCAVCVWKLGGRIRRKMIE